MNKLFNLLILLLIITGCSFKIPPGTYSTSNGPSFAGRDLTLTDNGRFQYSQWTDDYHPTIGHGAYIIVGKYLLLLFENANIPKSNYSIKEIPCVEQDTQIVNFKIRSTSGEPLLGVSIYNKNDHSQGTMTTSLEGIGQVSLPKKPGKKIFVPHYGFIEPMEIEFDGDKCLDIDITLKEKVDHLQRGHFKAALLKREGDQLFWKMSYWSRKYSKIYLRE